MELDELVIIKARIWLARDEKNHLKSFKCLHVKIKEMKESFGVLLTESGEEIGDL
jgi:hypothetical protein